MTVRGKIVAFDRRTWWGEAVYDLTVVSFHGTTVNGFRAGFELVGRECDLLFNDNGDLYDVRIVSK